MDSHEDKQACLIFLNNGYGLYRIFPFGGGIILKNKKQIKFNSFC